MTSISNKSLSIFGVLLVLIAAFHTADARAQIRIIPKDQTQIQFSFSEIAEKTLPAVVNIFTRHAPQKRRLIPQFGNQHFLEFFFPELLQNQRPRTTLGSGVIVSRHKIVVTNHHVIENASEIFATLTNGQTHPLKLILSDPQTDIAILKFNNDVDKDKLTSIPLAQIENLKVGDLVLAIGNPFGVGQTVTSGIISALARSAPGFSELASFIQTDASINPGNSGGALVNMDAKLVGINTAIFSKSGGSVGIGFATPVSMIARIIDDALQYGKIIRPWLGIKGQVLNWEEVEAINLDNHAQALIVSDVHPQGSAFKAGIQKGDIILTLNHDKIHDLNDLSFKVATYPPGTKLPVEIFRKGKTLTKTLTLLPPDIHNKTHFFAKNTPFNGTTLAEISPDQIQRWNIDFNLKGILLTKIEANAPARRFGFKPGDIIQQINGQEIENLEQVIALENNPPEYWDIIFHRQNRQIQLRLY
ncbi:MAG: Do family serine endopeptidase [Pseudomonadota bacterium]